MYKNYIDNEIIERAKQIEKLIIPNSLFMGCPISFREKWEEYAKCFDVQALFNAVEGYINETYLLICGCIETNSYEKLPVNPMRVMRIIEQLTLAECIENKGRFLVYISDYVKYMCALKTWVAKYHYNAFGYTDDDEYIELVDLGSASFSWRFAVCDCILGEKLDNEIREMIKEYIDANVLSVYKKAVQGNRADKIAKNGPPLFWMENDNNWLSVCLSGVTMAMLWYSDDIEEKAIYIAIYERLIQPYLRAFKDGYSHEGLEYWGYGFSKFVSFSEALGRLTGYKLDLFNNLQSIEASLYGFRSEMSDNDYPSVADSSFCAMPLESVMIYTARRLHIPYKESYIYDFKEDIHMLMLLLRWDDTERPKIDYDYKFDRKRTYFKEQGILISRNDNMAVLFKGGNNIEAHNHNDLGSFIVSVAGEQLLVDVGYTEYGDTTFTESRYTANALNSYGHSVPLVMGKMQMPEIFECDKHYEKIIYAAKVINTDFSDNSDTIEYDLKEVYDYPDVLEIKRKMKFIREESQVEITDEFVYAKEGDFESAFLTYSKVQIYDNHTLSVIGKKNNLLITFPENIIVTVDAIEGVVINGHSTHVVPVRVGFKFNTPLKSGKLKITIKLN